MKILFLNYEYPPLGGGAANATEGLLKEWAKPSTGSGSAKNPDLEVHLVTSAVGSEREQVSLGNRVYVHRLPIGKNPKNLHSQSIRDILMYTWRAWLFLFRFIPEENKKKRFDITLAFFTVPSGFLAYLLEIFFRVPYVVSLRGADVPGFSEKYNTLHFFIKPLLKHIWRRAKRVLVTSVGHRELAHNTNPRQTIEVLENGVDTEIFRPSPEEIKHSPVVFLSTSRLTERKQIGKFVEAFAQARSKTSVFLELHLAGEGDQEKNLREKVRALGIEDQVKFLGRISHDELPTYYQKASVFVLPSRNEGMSNSALEALASGLPLVVSDTGGMSELVTEGENGFFVNPELVEGFAATLLKFVESPSLISQMGAASRAKALTRSWSKVAEEYLEVLGK